MKNFSVEKALPEGRIRVPFFCFEMKRAQGGSCGFSHYHGYTEMLYVNKGEALITICGKDYTFTKGGYIIINPYEPHRVESLSGECSFYVIKFTEAMLQGLKDTGCFMPFLSGEGRCREKSAGKDEIFYLFSDALKEYNEKKTGYELEITAAVLKIIRFALKDGEAPDNDSTTNSTDGMRRLISDILLYTNRNFRNIEEKEVAERFGISYSYFSRSFKRIMNMSFNEYINFLKINEAQKILLTENKSIAEISRELSYATPSHFINVFRRFNNISPKQYKKAVFGKS